MAISRYVSLPEKKDMLFQMLQWMPGQGYVADSATRNLILKNSHLFGRQQIAEILSKQHMISKAYGRTSGPKLDVLVLKALVAACTRALETSASPASSGCWKTDWYASSFEQMCVRTRCWSLYLAVFLSCFLLYVS
ncbi:hypothetical protein ACFX19_027372 [Malus domestica]